MDYIVTTAKAGKTHFRQKYSLRTAALEKFERLVGSRVENLVSAGYTRHTVPELKALAPDGSVVTFRMRN